MKRVTIVFCLSLCWLTLFAQQKNTTKKHKVLTNKNEMPSYPGDLGIYLMQHIKISGEVKGQEVVQFLVNKDGSLSQFKIINSLGPECDKEVVRVLTEMPKWKPGKEKGKPVPVWYNLPILVNKE